MEYQNQLEAIGAKAIYDEYEEMQAEAFSFISDDEYTFTAWEDLPEEDQKCWTRLYNACAGEIMKLQKYGSESAKEQHQCTEANSKQQ